MRKTHCPKLANSLFIFQPAVGMHTEVLCPKLTSELFVRDPAPCKGPASPFAYKQLQLVYQHYVTGSEKKAHFAQDRVQSVG